MTYVRDWNMYLRWWRDTGDKALGRRGGLAEIRPWIRGLSFTDLFYSLVTVE